MLQTISDYISKVTRGNKVKIGDTDAQWKKVSELTPGMMIAVPAADVVHTDVAWDEIVSIRRLSPERVYDIEVEDTHNFVAGHLLETPIKNKIGSGKPKWFGGFFAHNTYANLKSGLIKTEQIIGKSAEFVTANISSLVANTINVSEKITSPLVETDTLRAKNITANGTATFGELLISGNATFDGTVSAKQGAFDTLTVGNLQNTGTASVSGDATISGTLYADNIKSSQLTNLQSSFGDLLNSVNDIRNHIASDSGSLATTSADLLSQLPDQLNTSKSLLDRINDFLASSSAQVSTPSTMTHVSIPTDLKTLTVVGSTSLADTAISGMLTVDGGILIENSTISSLTDTLSLRAFNSIDVMGGKLVVDSSGNLTIEGTLIAKGGVITDSLKPIGNTLTIDLSGDVLGASASGQPSAFGKLLITGLNNEPIASISATGDATFSGVLTADKLNILKNAFEASASGATTSAQENLAQIGVNAPGIKTQDSAGWAILPAGSAELIIFNPNITEKSLIYITPTSPTQNRTLFVADKKSWTYFRVALDSAISSDVKFNWWIVN